MFFYCCCGWRVCVCVLVVGKRPRQTRRETRRKRHQEFPFSLVPLAQVATRAHAATHFLPFFFDKRYFSKGARPRSLSLSLSLSLALSATLIIFTRSGAAAAAGVEVSPSPASTLARLGAVLSPVAFVRFARDELDSSQPLAAALEDAGAASSTVELDGDHLSPVLLEFNAVQLGDAQAVDRIVNAITKGFVNQPPATDGRRILAPANP